jgi:hypothetical protein
MSRDRFIEIMEYLRFDIKAERSKRLGEDKFALASGLWTPFIENCKKAYIPNENLTIDEQLFPSKCRCPFTQYIASKPDKFGVKYFLLVDVETKYVCNGFPYLGKDHARPTNQSLPSYVVSKLLEGFDNNGHNVTFDNFFTSLALVEDLAQRGFSCVGTIRNNRREMPDVESVMKRDDRFHSRFFLSEKKTILTAYKTKKNKIVSLISSAHDSISVDAKSKKQKSNIIQSYNTTKCGVDCADQMLRQYSTRCQTRRWPVGCFYNVLDMCLLNSWIVFKIANKSNISRRDYQLSLIQEMCTPATPTPPLSYPL